MSKWPEREFTCPGYDRICGATFRARRAKYCPECRPAALRHGRGADWTPSMDDLLRGRYRGRQGQLESLARSLGLKESAVRTRLITLGLIRPRVTPRWTANEDAFIEQWAGTRSARWIKARLPGRTLAAVKRRFFSLGISRAIREGYTLKSLTQCFGTSKATVTGWIRTGRLVGSRTENQSGFHEKWEFSDAEVFRFIREHPTQYQLDRVDQTWFLGLVLDQQLARDLVQQRKTA